MLAIARAGWLAASSRCVPRTSPLWLPTDRLRAAALDTCSAGAPQHAAFSVGPAKEPEDVHHQETSITDDELRERKSRAVRGWMEAKVGPEKLKLAQILKDHHCLVRGGAEQGQKLMDALLEWKANGAASKLL